MQKQIPIWLDWAREIQALAQTGQHYSQNDFDRERYQRLTEIAAEIIHQHSELSTENLVTLFTKQCGYATPRVDVRGAVFEGNKLLLVRERMDGKWTMPGGWADVGDVPSEAAEREVWEEAGLRVKARKIIGIYDANRFGPLELFHAYKMVFLCDWISGETHSSMETSEAAFFSLEEIPAALSGERTHPRHIQDAFMAKDNPDLPAVFD
jgi:ADP-ribose pyrophosphatase YjhB (NUDIX family)